ncbi:GNAT family N-acetyltransferase [Uliginosibacterium sp. H3]|uniref:GNAT family N-acetyltransferase n=1 Tax=Uliginosibacterium silvisoli TaxID=3114758 RepID=A0ABU6K7B5_9RHOO|nr:GNAT family N-acetyltransferase [Uliginosibacterium sp. H3]
MPGEYIFTTDQSRFDLTAIHAFLSQTYWAPGVPFETIERATRNSLSFGILHGDEQVGFARVVTDKATFAYLADVYVLEAHRGHGLSKRLMEFILAHEDLQGLRRFLLFTKDAHGLYAQYGFKEVPDPSRVMERFNPTPHKTA